MSRLLDIAGKLFMHKRRQPQHEELVGHAWQLRLMHQQFHCLVARRNRLSAGHSAGLTGSDATGVTSVPKPAGINGRY